ncbi:class I SAM-dependent methyltransferase [Spiractinospora alimapuensis]|uniref:class I SAM-dependent methyltransferase n=1 Tax=Spiractinospora alimapuensis TaxID=2820884 RepID=UPI001F15B20D|nr:class I SAM-dependent methyltransferase [Spiractinospora alimapuensis]QVQ50346.1 class I SAM-dependent methyltransferase [Spiractinospora alimapuensis]
MTEPVEVAEVARRAVGASESARANRLWWDASADEYQAEHGDFLNGRFVWGPEGLDEAREHLLGDLATLRDATVLEVGCGAAACARWLRQRRVARVVGIDVSSGQLRYARRGDHGGGNPIPLAQADAQRLPFADAAFDVVFSAYGGFPFVPRADDAVAESARVLRPGGRLVFSVSHPIRWCFPDDPTEHGLVANQSYFDRRAYVEEDTDGRAVYVEHHHTTGDWVRAIARAGLRLLDLIEPEWPEDNHQVWGGWSPTRGRILPGTAIFVAEKPAPAEPEGPTP